MQNHILDLDKTWLQRMRSSWAAGIRHKPNYYLNAPESLHTTAHVQQFVLGTGERIIAQLATAIESAKHEVVFVTCFWAPSASLTLLGESLKHLSERCVRDGGPRVRVFIGFSSLSISQKLFQTSSPRGRRYPPGEWVSKLGLPNPEQLLGLDMTIKSIFVRPFSVMHPKFAIIDRETAWMPSCNVSWESWFEGAIVLSGPVVEQFTTFWMSFWMIGEDRHDSATELSNEVDGGTNGYDSDPSQMIKGVKALFLPSPHHAYALCLPFWMATSPRPPPSTPLTNYLLAGIQAAKHKIHVQTPNLTAFAVIHELLSACQKGVDLYITTSENLMVLEQLVTAGTTTKRAVKWLVTRYRQLRRLASDDLEAESCLGRLQISFFNNQAAPRLGEPVKTHIKLTIIDEEIVVLGSQNLDRASWYTSQELCVAFASRDLAHQVKTALEQAMNEKRRIVFDSTAM